MRVVRETAGIALPFAAGVLLAVFSGYGAISSGPYFPMIAYVSMSSAMLVLMSPARRMSWTGWLWLPCGIAAMSAGMICGITSAHIGINADSTVPIFSRAASLAEGWGLRMQDAIDRLPFRDDRCNALAKALVTGEKADIPESVISAFSSSGASHILALSGLHLGIIYGIINRLFSIFGNHHRIWIPRSAVIILMCGFYTLATGAGPSIVRSFLFILLAESARLSHRHASTGQLLFAAIIIQLTISPQSVRSAGFQLSYSAMAGIAFILPHLQSMWPGSIFDDRPFTKCIRKIWNICAMSISCQLTTAPLAWLHFGTFPKHFLLTNLLALPLTAMIIPVLLVTLLLESFGICPQLALSACEALLTALISALEVIGTM